MMVTEDREAMIEQIRWQARLLLQPLDLADLVGRGILAKKGAWYRVLKFNELGEHAFARVCEMKNDSRGASIKFKRISKNTTASLKKLVGVH